MIVAGIVDQNNKIQAANLICTILSSTRKKVSVIDAKSLYELGCNRVKDYIKELDRNNIDILILKINLNDFRERNIDRIYFDIIMFTGKTYELDMLDIKYYQQLLNNTFLMLDEKTTVIVNIDDLEFIKLLNGIKCRIITYGFNSKACITTSSIGDTLYEHEYLCCLQRSIWTNSGDIIEPQEYRVNITQENTDAYNVLAAVTFAIVNGMESNLFSAN